VNRLSTTTITPLLLALALAPAVAARAQDDPEPSTRTNPPPPGTSTPDVTHRMWWWSIPQSGRQAVKMVAHRENAVVTHCDRIERDELIVYEIHGRRRTGFLTWEDVILSSASEPKTLYEQRQYAHSFRGRMNTLRKKLTPEPDPILPIGK
jgi:hypothetical protein